MYIFDPSAMIKNVGSRTLSGMMILFYVSWIEKVVVQSSTWDRNHSDSEICMPAVIKISKKFGA